MTWAVREKGYSQRQRLSAGRPASEDLSLCDKAGLAMKSCASGCASWRRSDGGSAIGVSA